MGERSKKQRSWLQLMGRSHLNLADPVTGLTPKDKASMLDTWTTFRSRAHANALALFAVLFKRYPEYQSLFPEFAHVPLEELPNNHRLLAHALAVIYFLTSIIENLDDGQIVVRASVFRCNVFSRDF